MSRTREEALQNGHDTYYNMVPCDRNHISPYSLDGACVECARTAREKKRQTKAMVRRRQINDAIDEQQQKLREVSWYE